MGISCNRLQLPVAPFGVEKPDRTGPENTNFMLCLDGTLVPGLLKLYISCLIVLV
jgi:hypothetical protein